MPFASWTRRAAPSSGRASLHIPDFEESTSPKGGLNLPRCPQGQPVIIQAGSSAPGQALAARTAEVVLLTAQNNLPDAQEFLRRAEGPTGAARAFG